MGFIALEEPRGIPPEGTVVPRLSILSLEVWFGEKSTEIPKRPETSTKALSSKRNECGQVEHDGKGTHSSVTWKKMEWFQLNQVGKSYAKVKVVANVVPF